MNNTGDLWKAALELMAAKLTPTTIQTWFGDAALVEFSAERVILTTPNQIKQNLIQNKYMELLYEIWREIFSSDMEVLILTEQEYKVFLENREMESDGLDNEFTFDHFVVGNSNRFAHAAALAVANNPGTVYNPLLIHGPSGVGKTHLLLAISNKVKKEHPDWKITYKSTEDFTNEMVLALRNGKMQEFRNLYRQSHFLLLDDIQFIAGKDSIQEEFFHTFNALVEAKHQIVLTSDRPPKEIKRIEDRIRNRLEYGLLADINPPDYELRCAIVYKKSEVLGFALPTPVVNFLAEKIKSNVRQLEGAVKKIKALNNFMGMPLTVETAGAAIDDIYKENPGINPTPAYIIDVVAKFFGMSPSDLTGSRRGQDVVLARQAAIYLTRTLTKYSFPEIGAAFGGRDHTTIMHSVKKIEDGMRRDETLKNNIDLLLKAIRQE
jgi:chromosomal replication initiator protein